MNPRRYRSYFCMPVSACAFLLGSVCTAEASVVERTGLSITAPDAYGLDAVVLSDGTSIIAGGFEVVQGQPRNGLVRLRADGSVEPAWNIPCLAPPGSAGCEFKQIERGLDDWLYVLGNFSRLGDHPRNGLARVSIGSGSVDADWNPIPAESTRPDSFILVPDGVIASGQAHVKYALQGQGAPMPEFQTEATRLIGFAAGSVFGTSGFAPATLVKLNSVTGEIDSGWTAGVEAAAWLLVDRASASVIGRTEGANGGLIKVSALGNPGFQANWQPPSLTYSDSAFVVGNDGDLHLIVNRADQPGRRQLATIDLDGTGSQQRLVELPEIFSNEVKLLSVDFGGAAILSAYLTPDLQPQGWSADGSTIGRVSGNGSLDLGWRSGIFDYGLVYAAERTPDGDILVAGAFDRINGVPRNGIAKLTPDLQLDPWQAQVAAEGFTAASVDADGNVYVSSKTGVATLLKLSGETGAIDTSWNPSGVAGQTPNGEIEELLVDRINNVLYARFPFQSFEICGGTRTALAKLSLGPTCVVDPALQLQPPVPLADIQVHEGRLYIAGVFDSVQGQPIASLARFNADGFLDSDWRPFGSSSFPGPAVYWLTPTVRGMAASGAFATVQGVSRPGLAMFDFSTGGLDGVWDDLGDQAAVYSTGTLGDDLIVHRMDNSMAGSGGFLALVPTSGAGGTDPNWPALRIDNAGSSSEPILFVPLDSGKTLAVGAFVGLDGLPTGSTALLYRQPLEIFSNGFEPQP